MGLVGHHAILPCSLQPAQSAAEKTVEWTRPDLNPSFVHIFREGRLLYDEQNPSFHQRTSLFEQELKNGNMSLKLSDLKLSDSGMYTCKMVSPELETSIHVIVGAVSKPMISHEKTEGTQAVLRCDAKGWYPKPEIQWEDEEGNIIPPLDNNTESEAGHFFGYSRITVEMVANRTYTCIVGQQDIRQPRKAHYTFPYVHLEVVSKNAIAAIVTSCLMFVIALILMYLYGLRLRCERRTATTETEETDGLTLQERVDHLQQENERLQNEVRRLKEELERLQRENQTEPRRKESACNQSVQRFLSWCGNNPQN